MANTVTRTFEDFFRSAHPARDKYLSRFFALFSEHVVRSWCACPEAPYEDWGRPTLCEPGLTRGHTLDFTLHRRATSETFAAELKCELEYEGYRYLRLTSIDQLAHHKSDAFGKLLRIAKDPTALDVRRQGRPQLVDGAILIWGAVEPQGRQAVMENFAFADVLSVEDMIADLRQWSPAGWHDLIRRYRQWSAELFEFLLGEFPPHL